MTASARICRSKEEAPAVPGCYTKTRMCHFFLQKKCLRGSACNFAHTSNELKRPPDLTRIRLCPEWQVFKSCSQGKGCTFAHGEEELRRPKADSRRRERRTTARKSATPPSPDATPCEETLSPDSLPSQLSSPFKNSWGLIARRRRWADEVLDAEDELWGTGGDSTDLEGISSVTTDLAMAGTSSFLESRGRCARTGPFFGQSCADEQEEKREEKEREEEREEERSSSSSSSSEEEEEEARQAGDYQGRAGAWRESCKKSRDYDHDEEDVDEDEDDDDEEVWQQGVLKPGIVRL